MLGLIAMRKATLNEQRLKMVRRPHPLPAENLVAIVLPLAPIASPWEEVNG